METLAVITVAQLEERVKALQAEIDEHKRLCEEYKKEFEDLKLSVAVVKPWMQVARDIVRAFVVALLCYLAWGK